MKIAALLSNKNLLNKKLQFAIYGLIGSFSLAIFLKNAWVAEDAFIILRTVDQFLHGNGFRWNPHERAQSYTSPLWFLLLIASTAFCKTLYLNLIGLSLALHVALLIVMAALMRHVWRWAAAVLLLTLSQAFFDFTASGLEYPLIYLLLGSFVLLYLRGQPVQDRFWLAACSGLALITRHDLLFILSPMLLHLVWQLHKTLTRRQQLATLAIFLAPLSCWTLFSLIYYGFPFPNTAYAKLAITGVSQMDRLHRGLIFLQVSLQTDPITPILLAVASLRLLSATETRCRILGASILLAFSYVTWIGGDYMIGRFYAPVYLAAIIGLASTTWRNPLSNPIACSLIAIPTAYLLYGFILSQLGWALPLLESAGLPALTSGTPIVILCVGVGITLVISNYIMHTMAKLSIIAFCLLLAFSTQKNDSPWQTDYKDWGKTLHNDIWWMLNTVSRERYWIYRWTSLYAWSTHDVTQAFPSHPYCQEGAAITDYVSLTGFAGMTPYCMDRQKISVDIMALTDPLLARMPKVPQAKWASGGVRHIIPDGYIASLESGQNRIVDADLARYYDKLRILTEATPLFSTERIATIIAFNLGAYDAWLEAYKQRNP